MNRLMGFFAVGMLGDGGFHARQQVGKRLHALGIAPMFFLFVRDMLSQAYRHVIEFLRPGSFFLGGLMQMLEHVCHLVFIAAQPGCFILLMMQARIGKPVA